MAFSELDYKGVAFFGDSEVKFEQVPVSESHGELIKHELLGLTPHFLTQ